MKIGTNLIFFGLLSMIIGTAFASPLLISELEIGEITPFPEPPKGPKADLSSDLLYANFSINPNSERETLTDISYFVVLNVTNNSDDWGNITAVQFDAEVQNYTMPEDNSNFKSTGESGRGWNAEGAWVDGKWYNLTWVPNKAGKYGEDGFSGPFEPDSEGCWIEGVQIYELYVNYELAYTRMNMNGTWVDVTGRIEVTRPSGWPPNEPVTDGTIFSEIKFLRGGTFHNPEVAGLQVLVGVPLEFDECWAPHQSRLIALTDARRVPIKYFEASKLEKLETEKVLFTATVQGHLNSSTIWDSSAVTEETIEVQLEVTEDGYLYSTMPEDQMFVMDSFDVEVFIEPRN
jgi:hypothetical protein